MQPAPAPTPVPAAAPAPAAPAAPGATVLLPDGPLPLSEIPRSMNALRGLRTRRETLRDQLDRATNRRESLVRELNGEGRRAPPAEARVGIQRRIDLLDERILQLERDQAMTERLLASAPPELLSSSAQSPRNPPGTMDEDDAAAGMFAMFGLGIVLTLLFSRFRRRRAAKRGPVTATTLLAEDPRFAQLAQAVDAIAEEVERIGEGQRFVTQLLSSRQEERVLGEPQR